MSLIKIKGDLLALAEAGEFDFIIQGCNCFCTMGSGIAASIRRKWPEVYEADCLTEVGDYNKLGTYSMPYDWDGVSKIRPCNVINAYTQYGFNKPGETKDVFEYASFELILQKIVHNFAGCDIGMPYIGMGLAQGDTARIMAMIESFAEKMTLTGGSVRLVEFG